MFKNWDLDQPMTRRDYMNLGLITLGITTIIEVGIYVWYKYQMNEIERSYCHNPVVFTPIYDTNRTNEEDEDEEDYGL